MNRVHTTAVVLCLLLTLTILAPADQQVIYPPSAMPRVDMHTHMDAKTQYAKVMEVLDLLKRNDITNLGLATTRALR